MCVCVCVCVHVSVLLNECEVNGMNSFLVLTKLKAIKESESDMTIVVDCV